MKSTMYANCPVLRVFLGCALLASCGTERRNEESPRRVVGDAAQGKWAAGQEWRLVQTAVIGSEGENGPAAFANIVDVALDPMGRVWIADQQQHQIHVFDARGNYVRSVGRKGAGPAEFASLAGMDWDPAGRLWVMDSGNARFAVYDTAGRLIRTHPRNSIVSTAPWPGRFDRQGRLYDVGGRVRPDASVSMVIVRADSAAQPRDTFALPEFKPRVFQITRGDARNRQVTEVNVPFTGRQEWSVDPRGYVWVADTDHYRIERFAFSGGVERTVERSVPAVPVTREERDRMLENYRHFTDKGGRIDLSRIPDHHAALNGFQFDDAGNLWVSPVTGRREGRALDVFDPDGAYMGRVRLATPWRSSVRTIRGNQLVVVARDSLDVQTAIVMRIEKPAG